jgi:murein DD-endopeptidase MepM/ murein hydrolase activator NlpD
MKKDKYISLFIIPHHRGKQRTISLSRRTVKVLRIAVPAVFCILVAFLVDYIMMNGTRRQYKQLKHSFAQQEAVLTDYQQAIGDLEATIQAFDAYRTKLNIMTGLKSEETLEEEPGVGGPGDGQLTVEPGLDQGLSRLGDINSRAAGIEENLVSLNHYFENQNAVLAQTPSIMPTRGFMASGFKYRTDPFTGQWVFHPGLDIATQQGNPVVATADGIVISVKTEKRGGKTIKLSHPLTGWVTVYCHLSEFKVKNGQRVKRGQTIGLVGRTGRARAPHVHYEVRREGKRYNPWNFILDQ